MKRRNHSNSTKIDDQWPIEETQEKIDILHEGNDHREIGNHLPSVVRPKVDVTSESYRRAVSDMAYALWETSGRTEGSAEANWLKAEAALKFL